MSLKKLFWRWAYIDLEGSCDGSRTYFARFSEEISRKNLTFVRYLSLTFAPLCAVISCISSLMDAPAGLTRVYTAVAFLELALFVLSSSMLKRGCKPRACTLLTVFYLLHLLAFTACVGTVLSPDDSASIYFIGMLLSQLLFILPPLFTTALLAGMTAFALWLSWLVKSPMFFRIDLLNCFGVFLLSVFVGWLVNKVRVEEAFARSRAQQLNAELTQLSTTDQLTGLPNHRSFQENFYRLFAAARDSGRRLGVIMLDIDQFKAYNDNYGHIEGDRCLAALGAALQRFQSDGLFFCRFGGEEFLALLDDSLCDRALAIAESILDAVRALAIPHAHSRVAETVTMSAGLFVGVPSAEDHPMSLVDRADRAMYRCKADGGDRLAVFGSAFLNDRSARIWPQESARVYLQRSGRAPRRKVLVADDNALNRALLSRILANEYEAVEAADGAEALEKLRQGHAEFSAVLLDLAMPVMDGFGVLEAVQTDSELSKIPVLVTTGSDYEDAEIRALELGANDFILKPYKPGIILRRLANLINLRETAAIVNAVERDELTGVFNKEFFYKQAEQLVRSAPARSYDILCCDVQRFKLINELYGVKTGDALLRHIGAVLLQELGVSGVSGRVGGDTFACVVPHRARYDNAYFAERQRAVNEFPLSLSIDLAFGVYVVDDPSLPINTICDRAFSACDSVKGRHDRCFAVYDDTLRGRLLTEQFIADSMNTALAERQFRAYYQPKVDLATGEIVGAEALARWLHPERGLLAPGEFIPVFERNGFIDKLDHCVWQTACEDLARWSAEGRPALPVSVNVSRADIYNSSLVDDLLALLERYGIAPQLLHLEITETAYTEDSEQLIRTVTALKQHGFVIEMDDFGTGYSSLSMLARLPISTLKLDRSLIASGTGDGADSVLEFVLSLAERLGLAVIAEGVETERQAKELLELGCRCAQGFHFSRPVPCAEFERLCGTRLGAGRGN